MRYSSLAPYAPPRRGDRKEVCHHEPPSSPSRTPRRTALSVSSSRFRSRYLQWRRSSRLYPGHQLARRLLFHRCSLRRRSVDRTNPQHAFRNHARRQYASPLPRQCVARSLASRSSATGHIAARLATSGRNPCSRRNQNRRRGSSSRLRVPSRDCRRVFLSARFRSPRTPPRAGRGSSRRGCGPGTGPGFALNGRSSAAEKSEICGRQNGEVFLQEHFIHTVLYVHFRTLLIPKHLRLSPGSASFELSPAPGFQQSAALYSRHTARAPRFTPRSLLARSLARLAL